MSMESGRGFRVPDWVPEWIRQFLCCFGLEHDNHERTSHLSSTMPLQGSPETFSRVREDTRNENDALLGKRGRSDADTRAHGDAGSSGASASTNFMGSSKNAAKSFKYRTSSPERSKALEDFRFSSLAVPTYSTTRLWQGSGELPPSDEDVCAICLEEYDDSNPKNVLSCAHSFHLGCILEWEERGHNICPLCDVVVASSLAD